MKLHTPDWQATMPHAHDLTFCRPCSNFKTFRQRRTFYQQGVISGRIKRIREANEELTVIMKNRAGLAMHQAVSTNNLAAIGLTNRLVPQTHTEDRQFTCKMLDGFHRDTGFI